MLQVSVIKENPKAVVEGLTKKKFKNASQVVDEILALDEKRRKAQHEQDKALAESNALAKRVGELMKSGQKEEAEKVKAESAALKETVKQKENEFKIFDAELFEALVKLPNLPHVSVPFGNGADDNEVVKVVGEAPKLIDNALPHWELIKKYDIIDFDLGIKISGAGFPVYKKKGAKLQRALVQFFLDHAEKKGYDEVIPPLLVNEASGFGTGQLPDKDGQMYHATADDLYLIPTAEVPITNLYRDVLLKEDQLPIKNVGYTPCFRREAGSWGAHVRGLNRLHQFDKVEIVHITKAEDSYATLEEMVAHVGGLLEALGLNYRLLRLCGGDISFSSALTYDFETWSAAQERWLEVSSVSNFETFQSNRLKLRYKNKEGKTELLHTLNGSALALPRIVATILENNQTEKGIKIPEVLVPYTGFEWID